MQPQDFRAVRQLPVDAGSQLFDFLSGQQLGG